MFEMAEETNSLNQKRVIFWVSGVPFLYHNTPDCFCSLWYKVPVFYRLGIDIVFPTGSFSAPVV